MSDRIANYCSTVDRALVWNALPMTRDSYVGGLSTRGRSTSDGGDTDIVHGHTTSLFGNAGLSHVFLDNFLRQREHYETAM